MSTAAASSQGIASPAGRLPDDTHIGRVVLQIGDLARSVVYYERVIGLRTITRDDTAATLGAHGDDRPLLTLRERAGARPVPRRGRLGLYHFAILLPDRAALGRFLAHLAGLGVHAGMSDHLVSEAVYLTDPDGLGIEVYADRPRGSWRRRNNQLEMATEPLDAADVIRAGGGAPWTGAPAGTTIGHVHLFVGELAPAERFYHTTLGLDKVVWSYPGALFMSAGGYHHHLGTNTWAAGAAVAEADDARMLEWELVTPGVAAAAAGRLEAAGYSAVATNRGWLATDPWGTSIRLLDRAG